MNCFFIFKGIQTLCNFLEILPSTNFEESRGAGGPLYFIYLFGCVCVVGGLRWIMDVC